MMIMVPKNLYNRIRLQIWMNDGLIYQVYEIVVHLYSNTGEGLVL